MAAGKWNMQKASGGVASITVADGVSNTAVVLPESGTVATTDNIVGFKNYIINGNFDIWQRGISQITTSYGSDDRWSNWNSVSTKTHSRIPCTDTERALFNASYFSRTVASSIAGATNNIIKEQSIEDVTRLAGKTVTLSFWAKADSNKNISVEFSQQFGTGGTPSAQVVGIGAQLVSLTTVWQKKTITVAIPSIVGTTLGTYGVHTSSTWIRFWFDAGSNYNSRTANLGQQSGTFDIAQVQLEEGSVATPFEQRPYGLELSLCKRYARDIGNSSLYGHIGNGFAYSNTGALIEIDVEGMRTIPVIENVLTANLFELEGPVRYTASAISINGSATANTNKINLNITSSGLTTGYALGFRNNNTTTNKIILSSEL